MEQPQSLLAELQARSSAVIQLIPELREKERAVDDLLAFYQEEFRRDSHGESVRNKLKQIHQELVKVEAEQDAAIAHLESLKSRKGPAEQRKEVQLLERELRQFEEEVRRSSEQDSLVEWLMGVEVEIAGLQRIVDSRKGIVQ